MRVFIMGGLGFVGTQLSLRLLQRGHEITVVDHSPEPKPYTPEMVKYIFGYNSSRSMARRDCKARCGNQSGRCLDLSAME